jgi:hypothetical protein
MRPSIIWMKILLRIECLGLRIFSLFACAACIQGQIDHPLSMYVLIQGP